jgi:hypothetical protein
MKLYLDDLRPTPPGFDLRAYTAGEAIDMLKKGNITYISFDHDLGEPEAGTGYEVAQWIEQAAWTEGFTVPEWKIHSANPVGSKNILNAMNSAEKGQERFSKENPKPAPFTSDTPKTLFVSDFDDTLAQTDARIIITKASGEVVEMDPADYAIYTPEPGDKFDFSEFEQLKNPKPIRRFVKLLQNATKNKRVDKVAILTARGHTRPVAQFLKMMGITSGVSIAAIGSSDPDKKARYIEKHIQDGYTRIAFIDDSPKNVQSVEKLRKKYPQVKLLIHQAKEHPDATETKPAQTFIDKTKSEEEQESAIAKQAKQMGLTDMKFGRYGRDGKVTHIIQNGHLVPKPKGV